MSKLTKDFPGLPEPQEGYLQHATFEVDSVDCVTGDYFYRGDEFDEIGVVSHTDGNKVTITCKGVPEMKAGEEVGARKEPNLTMQEMCEHIVEADLFLKEGDHQPTAEEIFEALTTPHNETFLVWDFYRMAVKKLRRHAIPKQR